MSPKSLFLLAATLVVLHFSIILYMLSPLFGGRNAFSDNLYSVNYPLRHPNINWCKELHWQTPPSQNVVALVSHPGSGNTWLRYLLQQATGILTGSIYMDPGLRVNGFPGENVTDGSVLVIKTHMPSQPERDKYTSAILLIRNPRDAILAEFNRLHKGHIGSAPSTAFRRKLKDQQETFWSTYVPTQLVLWEAIYQNWLTKFAGPIHIVFYEVLVKDTRSKLEEMLQFLNHTYTDRDIECAITHKEGIYRRRKRRKPLDPFTPNMYTAIDRVRNSMLLLVADYLRRKDGTADNYYKK